MKRKIAIVVINVVVGLFALYTYACYVRETEIQRTQNKSKWVTEITPSFSYK